MSVRSTPLWEKGRIQDPEPDPYLWLMDPDLDPGNMRIRIPNTEFLGQCDVRVDERDPWFLGKQMNDEKTAADYKVQGGSVLHLVLALRYLR